jgi:FkbM family methyltransferase
MQEQVGLIPTRQYARRRFFRRLRESVAKRYYRLRHDDRDFVVSYFGAKFRVNLRDAVLRNIALKNFERTQLGYMISACQRIKPTLFIDVGANVGLYACVVASRKLADKVIAFEPNAQNFKALCDNATLNLATINGMQAAASDRADNAFLSQGVSSNRGTCAIAASGEPVRLVTIDSVAGISNERIAMKIDVEGHEREVLRGSVNLLRSNTGYLQIETSPERYGDVVRFLSPLGYRQTRSFNFDAIFEK